MFQSFVSSVNLFSVLRLICNLPMLPSITIGDLDSSLRVSTLRSKNHKRRIDRYACEPGRELCPAIEGVQMHIGFHPRILERVFCVISVSPDPISRLECSIRVPRP